jgi:hypothetical protein
MNGHRCQHAVDAAEAIRALNHATLDPTGLRVDDVYDTVAHLASMAHRLEQTCRQLDTVLQHRLCHGSLVQTAEADIDRPGTAIAAASHTLTEAAHLATALGERLAAAQAAIAWTADPTPERAYP